MFFVPEMYDQALAGPVQIDCYTYDEWERHVTDYLFKCQGCWEVSIGRPQTRPGTHLPHFYCSKCGKWNTIFAQAVYHQEELSGTTKLHLLWDRLKAGFRKMFRVKGSGSHPS